MALVMPKVFRSTTTNYGASALKTQENDATSWEVERHTSGSCLKPTPLTINGQKYPNGNGFWYCNTYDSGLNHQWSKVP